MFGNKGYGWKLAASLAVAVGFAALCAWRGRDVKPWVGRCLARPEAFDGRIVWIPGGRVEAVEAGGFVVNANGARVRVLSGLDVRAGDRVEVRGAFRAAGPRVEAHEIRKLPPHARLRWVLEIVSVAVLVAVVANLLRAFSFHPEALRVEGRD